MAGLPLMFEPNQGQGNLDPSDPKAKFVARGSGYNLLLGSEGAILSLSARTAEKAGSASRMESLRMKLAGANQNSVITGAELLPGKSNYLIGNDPQRWKRGIPQFARVRYENVYPGVNLVFYGNQGRLEYDFQIAPGADPSQAQLQFDGAKQLAVKDGALVITGKNGSVQLEAPRVYQEIAGRQQNVDGSFVLRGAHRAGFAIGAYDHSRELVIDPVLNFSTYFGGANDELNNFVAVDKSFNVYLAGSTNSPNLATSSSCNYPGCGTLSGTRNVYIAKIQPPQGSNPALLLYVTYLGGTGTDIPVGIAADDGQDPYVAGTTTSSDFPVSLNAYQSKVVSAGNTHIFVTRLQNTASTLLYSSYLSGTGNDLASGMTIDGQGYLYVTGTTTSTMPQDYVTGVEWPVVSLPYGQPFQNTPKAAPGVAQFFVSKINTAAGGSSSIAYSTYFGGGTYNTTSPVAIGGGITVDSNSNIYFTGTTNFLFLGQNGTNLSDFPILNPYQPCLDTAPPTVIINPPSCSNTTNTLNPDAFVAKLNPAASGGTSQLVWSTYLGGANNDSGTGIALDMGAASVFVTGTTNSSDIASSILTSTTSTAYQRCLNTPMNPAVGTLCSGSTAFTDAYVAKFTNLGAVTNTTSNLQLTYFSFLGGTNNESGLAMTVDQSEGAILTGSTLSPDFPQLNTQDIQGGSGGGQDAFIARINTTATTQNLTGSWSGYFGGSGSDEGTGVALDPSQNIYFAGDTNSPNLQVKLPVTGHGTISGGYDAFVAEVGTASSLSISGQLTLGTNQTYISAGNQASFTYTIQNTGSDPAYGVTLIDDLSTTGLPVTFNSATASSGTCSQGSTSTIISCVIQSLASAATATVTIVITPAATNSGNSQSFTGGTVSVTSSNNITPVQTSVPAQMSDFSVGVTPSSASVAAAGDSAIYQVQFTPHPVYTTSIALSCTNVPPGATCGFSPASITLNGPGTAALVISTTARPIVTPASFLLTHNFYAMLVIVPILGWLAVGRRRRMAGTILMSAMFLSLLLLPACSKTSTQPPVSGTPAGQYSITVTATAGSDTKSTFVQLNVP